MMNKQSVTYQNIPVYAPELSRKGRLEAMVWPMLDWYHHHARSLPWRESTDAYRIWISEIMLQQTRVEAVKPYYARFLALLPDSKALAEVSEEQLLKLWEGLGYYSRARNLQKCARVLQESYEGKLPASYTELLKLPGIGSYTAGAIASIAYGISVPAVDGNVMRVLTRVCADDREITQGTFKKNLELELTELLQSGAEGRDIPPGIYNQALMEIGATVCLPNGEPDCENCPLRGICLAHQRGEEKKYPVKAAKKARKIENRTVFRIAFPGGYLLGKRPAKGLLAGMYEFPGVFGTWSPEEVKKLWEEQLGASVQVYRLGTAKHVFTHIEWHMLGYEVRLEVIPDVLPGGLEAVTEEQLFTETAMPSAFRAYMPPERPS